MSLLTNKKLWIAAVGVFLSGGLLLAVIGYVALVAYSGLVTGSPVVATLLEIAIPALLSITVLVALFVISATGVLWVLVQNASLPRSERIATAAERVEREYPPLETVGISSMLSPPEPSAEERANDALAALKQQYIDGEITEAEFERKVDRLVTNESIDEARATRERRDVKNADRNEFDI
jgi:hypothetical protein